LGVVSCHFRPQFSKEVARLLERGQAKSTKLKKRKLSPTFILPRDAGEERGGGPL
jgi:hypothetical protein